MKFAQSYRIRFTESGRHARATPVALFNLLQEIAVAHSSSVGRGKEMLHERGLAWMMNRAHLRFLRYPKTGEEVTITTWSHCLTGLYAIREWTLAGEDGACLDATSRWIVFNFHKKRIVKIPSDFAGLYGEEPERAIEDPFDRMQPIGTGEHERIFHVRVSDLDTNHHANSACYLDWALEAIPQSIAGTRRPSSIEVTFKKEAVLGEGMRSLASPVEPPPERTLRFHHTVAGEADAAPRAIVFSEWPKEAEFDAP